MANLVVKVGKDNHKKIILGKNGSNLKKIIKNASKNLENILNNKVSLKIFVKLENKS